MDPNANDFIQALLEITDDEDKPNRIFYALGRAAKFFVKKLPSTGEHFTYGNLSVGWFPRQKLGLPEIDNAPAGTAICLTNTNRNLTVALYQPLQPTELS